MGRVCQLPQNEFHTVNVFATKPLSSLLLFCFNLPAANFKSPIDHNCSVKCAGCEGLGRLPKSNSANMDANSSAKGWWPTCSPTCEVSILRRCFHQTLLRGRCWWACPAPQHHVCKSCVGPAPTSDFRPAATLRFTKYWFFNLYMLLARIEPSLKAC